MSSADQPDIYVASFNDVHAWGGGVAAANGLAEACRRRGLRPLILGVSPRAAATPISWRHADRLNVAVGTLPVIWRVQSWRVTEVLRRFLRRLPPPRVAFVGNSPFWVVAAKRTWPQVRVVYRFPCLLSNCLPFTWAHRKPPTFWERVNFAGVSRAETLALRLADLTLVATHANLEEVAAFCPSVRDRLAQCHFGCQTFAINDALRVRHRRELELDDDAFLVAAVGVCDRNKACDHAIRELLYVHHRARLAIVGDGPQRADWQQLAAKCGVAERVRFVGPQRDMGPWYAAADCVISASFYDAYPNTIREAISCGRPVVVPRHDPPHVHAGIAELVARERCGLLYDRQCPGELGERLNRLVNDPRGAEALGRRGREVAMRLFRWDECVNQTVGDVVSAAQRSPDPPPAELCETPTS